MTWLSRLIPNGRSSLQRATKRRRRMMSLEALEGRTLLSNVTVSFPTPSSPLTITGNSPTTTATKLHHHGKHHPGPLLAR